MDKTKTDKIAFKYFLREAAYYITRRNRPYKKEIMLSKKACLMIAHRGLSGIEKENTLPAFELAGRHSYFGIETDVHKSSDGKYVIIHDDTTGRVAEADFAVEQTDFETLRSLKLKDGRGRIMEMYRIPSLQEYIEVCKKYGKKSVLELKNHFEESEVVEIAGIIADMGYLSDTIFISFDLPNLIALRKHYPNQNAQFLTSVFSDGLVDTLKTHNLDLDIYYRELTKSRIDMLHDNGIRVNCWTVNTKKAAAKLALWGIDYITTNILE